MGAAASPVSLTLMLSVKDKAAALRAFVSRNLGLVGEGGEGCEDRQACSKAGFPPGRDAAGPKPPAPTAQHNPARPLEPSDSVPEVDDTSGVLDGGHMSALAAAVPVRYRLCRWQLLYSTARHGISLRTLYRNVARAGPCVTVVRDGGGHVFGAFTPVPWKVAPRFYGTGEAFVFKLLPAAAAAAGPVVGMAWPWWAARAGPERNDFFMLSSPESLALGGAGRPALYLDGELLRGSSGPCDTFGSPGLAGAEDFRVALLEVWGLA